MLLSLAVLTKVSLPKNQHVLGKFSCFPLEIETILFRSAFRVLSVEKRKIYKIYKMYKI